MVGPREGGLDGGAVALLEHEGDIVRDLVRPHRRRARTDRLGGLRHARPVLVIDDDAIGGVEGRGARLGDDDRHGVACEMHLVEGEEAVRRARHGPTVAALALDARAQQSETVRGGIRAGQDGEHAGRRERVRHVDARDARRRVRRAHHGHMGRVRRLDIVGVAPAPAHEAQILDPRHGRADAEGARPRAVLVGRSRHQIVAGQRPLGERLHSTPATARIVVSPICFTFRLLSFSTSTHSSSEWLRPPLSARGMVSAWILRLMGMLESVELVR